MKTFCFAFDKPFSVQPSVMISSTHNVSSIRRTQTKRTKVDTESIATVQLNNIRTHSQLNFFFILFRQEILSLYLLPLGSRFIWKLFPVIVYFQHIRYLNLLHIAVLFDKNLTNNNSFYRYFGCVRNYCCYPFIQFLLPIRTSLTT